MLNGFVLNSVRTPIPNPELKTLIDKVTFFDADV